MQDNPDGLDLATPSIAFHVEDLDASRERLVGRGVQATEVGDHHGTPELRVLGPEERWFAVTAVTPVIEDPLMQQIRYLDKLVDELAKGRPLEKVLRG